MFMHSAIQVSMLRLLRDENSDLSGYTSFAKPLYKGFILRIKKASSGSERTDSALKDAVITGFPFHLTLGTVLAWSQRAPPNGAA